MKLLTELPTGLLAAIVQLESLGCRVELYSTHAGRVIVRATHRIELKRRTVNVSHETSCELNEQAVKVELDRILASMVRREY